MKTISAEQFKKQYGEDVATQISSLAPSKPPTSIENVVSFGKGFVKGITEESVGTARMLQGAGQRVIAGLDPTKTLDEVREQTGFKSLGGEEAKQIDELLKSENTAEKAGKLTSFIATLFTPSSSRRAGMKVVEKGLDIGTDITEVVAPKIEGIAGAVSDVATGVKNVGEMAIENVSKIPSRIATNVAEKQATREAIQKLPTKIAQNAVQEGIDITDVQTLGKVTKEQKAPFQKLVNIVQKFAKGETKTNPIEIVGKPIINRIKQLESARGKVGQKLGEVANNLGNVTTKEIFTPVFDALKKVSGLSGLKVNKKGILDFTDTVLTTAETKGDREAIQKIFIDSIKNGTGKSKHLLRQELFEVLGGKKKALTNLTDTQEKAYNAIRQGLSNVLESKNSTYKSLSNEYRKIAQPLQDIRKFMKNVAGSSEDVLDMQAGLLARRLTSFSASNPQIRSILKSMDNATKIKGKSQLSVESLQDFYNILDKYYDITGKTGFQGQVKAGVEKASGISEAIVGTVRELAGSSQATRTKALEELLRDILK